MKIIYLNSFLFYLFFILNISFAETINYGRFLLNQKTYSIDISELFPFYETLPEDEKEQQIQDWSLYGLISQLNIPRNKLSEILHDIIPVRYSYLRNTAKFEISPGRIKKINDKDFIIILPEEKLNDISLIGYLVDRKIVSTNQIPENIYIFGYRLDFSSKTINVCYYQTISGKKVFSKEYNYFEKEVKNINDFKEFINEIDDITCVKWSKKNIVFGGRKYSDHSLRRLTLEDISSLYQAYNIKITPLEEEKHRHNYNIFINQKYQELIRNNRGLKKAIETGKIKKSKVLEEIQKRIPYVKLDQQQINIGFSLDPEFNYSGIIEDLIKLSNKDILFVHPYDNELITFIDIYNKEIISTVNNIKKQFNIEYFLALRRKFVFPKSSAEKRFDDILKYIEFKNSYQCARYDGKLQGTTIGMILFYTDLTAKLWAFDYNNTFPKNEIVGFKPMTEIKVPKLYWDEFIKLSKTRLWFGLRQESFEIYNEKLLLEPIATRVYSASSNPLFPGKETKPNFQSKEFLEWFDSHYYKIADYEYQYHKLNQIQKWGCIFTILKEEKSNILDFLFDVSVRNALDFEIWYKNNTELKCKTDLPFIDRNKYNKKTECLNLLYSHNYSLMGQTFFLFGGVSLASKKDIISKLQKSKLTSQTIHLPQTTPLITKNKTVQTKKEIHKEPLKQITINKKFVELTDNQKKIEFNCKIKNVNYGIFSSEKQNDRIVLKWYNNFGSILSNFLETLVKIQEKRISGYKDENIFGLLNNIQTVIRIEKWKSYLIKIKEIKDRWIYLSINEKISDCIAENSGIENDSDIFYAKLISQEQFNKLTTGKQLNTILFDSYK